jgi:hypothetical protein
MLKNNREQPGAGRGALFNFRTMMKRGFAEEAYRQRYQGAFESEVKGRISARF